MASIITNVLYYPEGGDFIRRHDNHEWLRFSDERDFINYCISLEFQMEQFSERWKIFNSEFMPVVFNSVGLTTTLPLEAVSVRILFEENDLIMLPIS